MALLGRFVPQRRQVQGRRGAGVRWDGGQRSVVKDRCRCSARGRPSDTEDGDERLARQDHAPRL
jgi:hypothetical protein